MEQRDSFGGASAGYKEYVDYMHEVITGKSLNLTDDYPHRDSLRYYLMFFDHIYNEPDTSYGRKALTRSNKFIYDYCHLNKITLDEYCQQKLNQIHHFLIHLKNRQTILTSLYDTPNFFKIFNQYSIETRRFLFGEIADRVPEYYAVYLSSKVKTTQKKILENMDRVLKGNKNKLQ